jgi:hypothetical protein
MGIDCELKVEPSCFFQGSYTASITIVQLGRRQSLLCVIEKTEEKAKSEVLGKAKELIEGLQVLLEKESKECHRIAV